MRQIGTRRSVRRVDVEIPSAQLEVALALGIMARHGRASQQR